MSEYNIGARIRKLRHDRRMTLQKVSTELGVSTALISQIENGHISPPITTLTRIARFFDVKMADFFTETEEPRRFEIVRAGEQGSRRDMIPDTGGKRSLELFSNHPFAKKLAPVLIEIPATAPDEGGHSHGGEEFILVNEGRLVVRYGDQTIDLDEGDSIYFDAETSHSLLPGGGKSVRLISIVSRQG